MKYLLFTLLTLCFSNSLIAQFQLEMGVGLSQSGFPLTNNLPPNLGDDAVLYIEGDDAFRMNWQIAGSKSIGEKSRMRIGLEFFNGETGVWAHETSSNDMLVLNNSSYLKLSVPIDFQYQLLPFARLTAGFAPSKYVDRNGFISIDRATADTYWTRQQQDEIVQAIDFVRTFSVDYRYGVVFLPLKNISVEVLLTGTLNRMSKDITYDGNTQNPNLKYRTAILRLGYTFSLSR